MFNFIKAILEIIFEKCNTFQLFGLLLLSVSHILPNMRGMFISTQHNGFTTSVLVLL